MIIHQNDKKKPLMITPILSESIRPSLGVPIAAASSRWECTASVRALQRAPSPRRRYTPPRAPRAPRGAVVGAVVGARCRGGV